MKRFGVLPSKAQPFTVVGVLDDYDNEPQPFADWEAADSPAEALRLVVEDRPGATVCGVFPGYLPMLTPEVLTND